MSDIFISYSRDDRATAQLLASALADRGWRVWWDPKIPPGKRFDEVIREALDSARCVIVLWSARSIESDWVKEEAAEGARRRVLVPCLIEDVRIPLGFGRIQAARLVDWHGDSADPDFKGLCEAVAVIAPAASGPLALPDLVPPAPAASAIEPVVPLAVGQVSAETEPADAQAAPPLSWRRVTVVAGLTLAVSIGLYLYLDLSKGVAAPNDTALTEEFSPPLVTSPAHGETAAGTEVAEPASELIPASTKPAPSNGDRPTKPSPAAPQEKLEPRRNLAEVVSAPIAGPPPAETPSSDDRLSTQSEVGPEPVGAESVPEEPSTRTDLATPSDEQETDPGPEVPPANHEQEIPKVIGGKVLAPVRLYTPSAAYTELARRAGLEGSVALKATVDKEGNVKSVQILTPLGLGLDRAAAQAVSRWKFKPATLDGAPVEALMTLTVEFRLD